MSKLKFLKMTTWFPKRLIVIALFEFCLASGAIASDLTSTRAAIIKEISGSNLDIGIAALYVESAQILSVNGNRRLPMASVYKFPIALAILKQVEERKVDLSEPIQISTDDIRVGAVGPIAREYPKGEVRLLVSTLLKYMVSDSDNSASDLLLKRLGGPKAATQIMLNWGFRQISIDRYEKQLIAQAESSESAQLDTASAEDLVGLYAKLFSGRLLNTEHTQALIALMTDAHTPQHIGNGLPSDTSLFHKSGWCSRNKCINDTALITLPENRGHLAIAILASGNIKDPEQVSKMIGRIARIAFDAAPCAK
jgi:beta-lactamase class A